MLIFLVNLLLLVIISAVHIFWRSASIISILLIVILIVSVRISLVIIGLICILINLGFTLLHGQRNTILIIADDLSPDYFDANFDFILFATSIISIT